METLEKQVEAYESQQKDYDKRIANTKRETQGARRELQRFNAQAATDQKREVQPIKEEEHQEPVIDVEENDLRNQVQDLLGRCLKKTEAAIDLLSEEEEPMDESSERTAKRPRSFDQSLSAGK